MVGDKPIVFSGTTGEIRCMGFFENLGELNVKLLKRRRDVDGLIKVLQTGTHPESREEAAEALGDIRDPKSVDPLIGAFKDRDHEVREEAAEALAKIGDKRAAEPLNALLGDPSPDVRRAAEKALERLR
jgi:HEAT repeat protein